MGASGVHIRISGALPYGSSEESPHVRDCCARPYQLCASASMQRLAAPFILVRVGGGPLRRRVWWTGSYASHIGIGVSFGRLVVAKEIAQPQPWGRVSDAYIPAGALLSCRSSRDPPRLSFADDWSCLDPSTSRRGWGFQRTYGGRRWASGAGRACFVPAMAATNRASGSRPQVRRWQYKR